MVLLLGTISERQCQSHGAVVGEVAVPQEDALQLDQAVVVAGLLGVADEDRAAVVEPHAAVFDDPAAGGAAAAAATVEHLFADAADVRTVTPDTVLRAIVVQALPQHGLQALAPAALGGPGSRPASVVEREFVQGHAAQAAIGVRLRQPLEQRDNSTAL